MKKALIILTLLFVFSCKPTKITTGTKEIFESNITHETKSIELGYDQDLILASPCDSLNKLRDIIYSLKSGNTNIDLRTENNKLRLRIKKLSDTTICKDSIVVKKEFIKEVVPVDRPVPYKGKWFWIGWGLFLTAMIWYNREYALKFLKWIINMIVKLINPL